MQTFLPVADLRISAVMLDSKRLGKQRVECLQILRALNDRWACSLLLGTPGKASPIQDGKPWSNHPASRMWKGYENALKLYYDCCLTEWIFRGFENTLPKSERENFAIYPPWFGNPEFHRSHRAQLLRKDFEYYSLYGWKEEPGEVDYFWPVS